VSALEAATSTCPAGVSARSPGLSAIEAASATCPADPANLEAAAPPIEAAPWTWDMGILDVHFLS
jgi:hypothetical protein